MTKKLHLKTSDEGKELMLEAGLVHHISAAVKRTTTTELDTLETRICRILDIVNREKRPLHSMLFFVMYDIESNKVRRQIAKYLIGKGCTRIQRSIYLADLVPETYKEIRDALTDIQAMYENKDSILICPVSTDVIRSMKVIGKEICIDIITRSHNTIFI